MIFVRGADETESKIFLFKISRYFLNNACFIANVVGFLIHMFGLRTSQKPLVFLNGYSQQDSLEIICGRSLLRKPTEIYSIIFLRNCSWIYFQEILFNIFGCLC